MLSIPNEIKDLLHQDTCEKNIRIHFPNGERTDICNDMIVQDSVSFTESLCSQNELKFGLCEASIFECETVGVGNIKGMTIEVSCEVVCPASVTGAEWKIDLQRYVYVIPYGTFTVDSAVRQADMQHRRIVAYGGTNNFVLNPMIAAKAKVPRDSADVYEPKLFATALMNFGVTQRLTDATYAEVDAYVELSSTKMISHSPVYPPSFYVTLELFYRRAYGGDDHDVYFVESPKLERSIDDIIAELVDGSYYQDSSIPDLKKLFDMFIKQGLDPYSLVASPIACTNCPHVYPYQGRSYGCVDKAKFRLVDTRMPGQTYQFEKTVNLRDISDIKIYRVDYSNYPQMQVSINRLKGANNKYYLPDNIDYLELTRAMMELNGLYMNVSSDGEMKLINLRRQFNLLPDEDIYPGDDVYPAGTVGGRLLPEDYQSCWYEDEYTIPFGAVQCQYKNTSEEECIYIYYMDGYDEESGINTYRTYDFSDNSIIRAYTWTEAQIEAFCQTIAANINEVSYMPVQFVGRGLPYVEAGDTFEILTASGDSITTIVLHKTTKGEQCLTDEYQSV